MEKRNDTKLEQLLDEYGFPGVIEALRNKAIRNAVNMQVEGASERNKERRGMLYRTAKTNRRLATKLNRALQVLEPKEDES